MTEKEPRTYGVCGESNRKGLQGLWERQERRTSRVVRTLWGNTTGKAPRIYGVCGEGKREGSQELYGVCGGRRQKGTPGSMGSMTGKDPRICGVCKKEGPQEFYGVCGEGDKGSIPTHSRNCPPSCALVGLRLHAYLGVSPITTLGLTSE